MASPSVDTAPQTPSSSDEFDTKLSLPMHQAAQLHTAELLTLVLDPDLPTKLTAGALLAADNLALFQLLPLILAAIQRIGETSKHRQAFVRLVSVLRTRVVACRGLKLRFLLLAQNPAFATHWDVRMVHRRQCYLSARHLLDALVLDEVARNESNESVALVNDLILNDTIDGPVAMSASLDTKSLIDFAARTLLHPTHGIRTHTIVFHMRPYHTAFHATELVDAIMERANVPVRADAIAFAQRLQDVGVIVRAGSSSRRFLDERKHIFQSVFKMQHDDQGHCCVTTSDGTELKSWHLVEETRAKHIKQIALQIPMDMIDLQSHEFWTNSVYVRGVDKGFRYGYRAITHPLYCGGLNPMVNMDFSKVKGKVVHTNTGITEQLSLDATISVVSDDVNDLTQESAVIGSVVVRKVFSSIARPMIIQLRVPIENADLEDDDHHIVLPPGLLVKEGDNLMQDLGVEIMFQVFNHIWAHTTPLLKEYDMCPLSVSYEVFPTSTTQGFMEAVTGLTSLKEYDWKAWRNNFGGDKQRVKEMLRSTVGSYVGAYVVGGRDRHFDNVLVKDDLHLLHIDFGFLMGTSPPIDGPPIAIAPHMEVVFRELKVWDTFVKLFVDAYMALRSHAPSIIRTSVLIFTKAGYGEDQIRHFLQGKYSLNVHDTDKKAGDFVRKQLIMSSGDIKTRFKQFSHEHIDPAWYGLLEKGFPPAVAIMKLVDAKEQKAAKKLADSKNRPSAIADDEKIQVDDHN